MSNLDFSNYESFIDALKQGDHNTIMLHWLTLLEISDELPPLGWDLITSFKLSWLRENKLIPIASVHNRFYMAHPNADSKQQAELTEALQQPVSLYSCSEQAFTRFWQHVEVIQARLKAAILESPADTRPLTQIFQDLLLKARQHRASDIHLEPQIDHSVLVRYRIDGLLHEVRTLQAQDSDFNAQLVSQIKVAADLDIVETRIPQDGRITERIADESVDLRVSTLPSLYGEKIVIRLLPNKNPFQQLNDLGLEGEALQTYERWMNQPQGIILVTGQTGSGKTSTLYTTLAHVLNTQKNVVTIEDPIEYPLKGTTQVQVHPKVGLTFASGLRSILRQDPDTILLGEIRDAETAEVAYQAALTGHLILSTLHTNDAPSAIIRLIDMGIEPYLIASVTLGIVAQRLIRRVCKHCATAYTPEAELLKSLSLPVHNHYKFYKAVGCEECFHTGYYGREGIFEIMPFDDALANLIYHKEQLTRIRHHLQSQKIQTLYESAINKVVRGLSTMEEINRVIPPGQQHLRSAHRG